MALNIGLHILSFNFTSQCIGMGASGSVRNQIIKVVEVSDTGINNDVQRSERPEIRERNNAQIAVAISGAQSIVKRRSAQSVVVCHICKKDPNIYVKCYDCDSLYCKQCYRKDEQHRSIFGGKIHNVMNIRDLRPWADISLTIVQRYTTNIREIDWICPCSDESIWIGIQDSKVIKRIKPDGAKIFTCSTTTMGVYRATILPRTNNLLISSKKSNTRLQEVDVDSCNISRSVYDISPFETGAIHVSKQGKIVAAGRQSVVDFDEDDEKDFRTVIVVMDKYGKIERSYEKDENNKPIFQGEIHKMESTKDGFLHVIDTWCSSVNSEVNDSRVVVLDKNGKISKIYEGQARINIHNKPFCAWDIVTTKSDNVIILDLFTAHLHVISSAGIFLCLCDLQDNVRFHPYAFAITRNGDYWLACRKKKMFDELYQLEIKGC